MSSSPSSSSSAAPPEDLEWEEWDSATSPLSFPHHCLAGSFAGVIEHTLLYPLDTVKTCWQSQVLRRASGDAGAAGCAEGCGASGLGSAVRGGMAGGSTAGGGAYEPLYRSAAETAGGTGATPSATSTNPRFGHHPAPSSGAQSQGIWSTMKNLMRQGHHHHNHPVNHQFSHAHVYTLAGSPPNVVDLTAAPDGGTGGSRAGRPWSRQSRTTRNATIHDITSRGLIRAAGEPASAIGDAAQIGGGAGFGRLWRGVQTMFVGCIPAHALYFSSYEAIKAACTEDHRSQAHHAPGAGGDRDHVGHDTLSPGQAMTAGGVATLLHDFVMTPMDTMKQRMQLGHYHNLRHAFVSIVWGDPCPDGGPRIAGEGWRGLYRSLPITVMTNVPYGMIMMTTNEWLRGVLEDGLYGFHSHEEEENPFHFATILLSGMGAGTVASAATAPLDRIKTRLQTQRMGMVLPGSSSPPSGAWGSTPGAAIVEERALAAARGEPKVCMGMAVQDVRGALGLASRPAQACSPPARPPMTPPMTPPKTPFKITYYSTPLEAFRSILQEEGPRGLFRGTLPRVALHAPSVAISWTAYEMAKDWLLYWQ